MLDGKEQIKLEFHNRARANFFSVYHTFEDVVSNVSRRNDEFRFQQLKRQYAVTLEQELQLIAKDILNKYKNERQLNAIDQMFHQLIKDYLHRFVQKVNDL
jgi:hypothetical protein